MRIKLFLFFIVLSSLGLLGQNKKNIHGEVPPFTVSGKKTLNLSSNFFSCNMSGTASVILIIDKKCNLLNFVIVKISVADDIKENIYNFWDPNILNILSENKFTLFKKDYYPLYVQVLYDLINELVTNLMIEYSTDTKDLKEINELSFLIRID